MRFRRIGCVVTAGALALSMFGMGPKAAAAPPVAFFNQETEVNPVDGTECVSGVGPGIETITFTDIGQFVQTKSGFHFAVTETIDSHTIFTNGYHMDAVGHAHVNFNTNFTSGETVTTLGGPEIHTIFNAQDVAVAQAKFVGVAHTTYRDLNGNGQPDDGEITSSFERFHFICS